MKVRLEDMSTGHQIQCRRRREVCPTVQVVDFVTVPRGSMATDGIDFILINLTIDSILVSTVIIYCFQILIKFELAKLKLT